MKQTNEPRKLQPLIGNALAGTASLVIGCPERYASMCIRLNRPIMTMLPCLMLLVLTSCLSGPPGRSLNDTLQIDGTRIGVLKGMMRFLADDSELAVVIAHELGHCRRGHVEQRRARQG